MRKARFTQHQIIAILKSVEAGRTVKEVCREAAISKARFWTGILDFYLFRTLNEAQEIMARWLAEYNSGRPHESLNSLTPEEYRLMVEKPEISKSV
ncbi:hypothetical protein ALQ63_02920 [Serratia plymuthica]|nr:hypothetical protein ALQ63_02920 [Serratia plymuthica]